VRILELRRDFLSQRGELLELLEAGGCVLFCGFEPRWDGSAPTVYVTREGDVAGVCTPPFGSKGGYIFMGYIWEVADRAQRVEEVECHSPAPKYSSYEPVAIASVVEDALSYCRAKGRAPPLADLYLVAVGYLYRATGLLHDDAPVLNYFMLLRPKTYCSETHHHRVALSLLSCLTESEADCDSPEFVVARDVDRWLGRARYIAYLAERGVFDSEKVSVYRKARRAGYRALTSPCMGGHLLLVKVL
jgi:hypothetical protein